MKTNLKLKDALLQQLYELDTRIKQTENKIANQKIERLVKLKRSSKK